MGRGVSQIRYPFWIPTSFHPLVMGTISDSLYKLSGKDTESIRSVDRSNGIDTFVDVFGSTDAETTSVFKVGDVHPHHSKLAGIVMCMVNQEEMKME